MQQSLDGAEHVLSIAQIGATLRVLSENSDAAEASMRERLEAIDAGAELKAVTPNLEDVFVMATLNRAPRAEAA
jgi:ABC-2 type transport system ATP-binding protein